MGPGGVGEPGQRVRGFALVKELLGILPFANEQLAREALVCSVTLDSGLIGLSAQFALRALCVASAVDVQGAKDDRSHQQERDGGANGKCRTISPDEFAKEVNPAGWAGDNRLVGQMPLNVRGKIG